MKCPKCKGGDLMLYEYFTVTDAIELEGGKVTSRHKFHSVDSQMKFRAECHGCDHTWYPRYETAMEVVEEAQDLLD